MTCAAGRCSAEDSLPATLKGGFASFQVPRPESSAAWEGQKPQIRQTLWRLLGDLPPRFVPRVTIHDRTAGDGYQREYFTFDNGVGDTVYGYLLLPAGPPQPRPAILYQYYHGDRYAQGKEELLIPAFLPLGNNPMITGEELVRAGYVVLCIDAYAFGQRRFQGPAGEREEGRQTETSLFKTFLWEGRTLWGMMVRDDLLALDYLVTRPEVDPQRIATMGMSMGSTRAWWAAALDVRIKVVISAACLTRYQNLIAAGGLGGHGVYYFVPNVLREKLDTEAIVGLIAPRAHLTLTGDQDAGSPVDGVRVINAFQEHLYRLYAHEERFRGVIYPGVGHVYTPEMWRAALGWLKEQL
jgi:hypothetical protein